jgi:penicillin-binding protein 1C
MPHLLFLTRTRLPHPGRWQVAGLVLLGLGLSVLWPVAPAVWEQGAVVSVRVTDREGGLLREVRPAGRGLPIPLADIPLEVIQALLAVEDRRFYAHKGVDSGALVRALWSNLRHGEVVSGASTLTMQVARTLRGRTGQGSWWDKVLELHLALRLERTLSKDAILALWLNRVPFGNQAYGIEAAARLYFGKSARDLTTAEGTYLVGLPQRPTAYNPFRHPEVALARHQRVLAAMEAAGVVTASERAALAALPITLVSPAQAFSAPHFVQTLLRTYPHLAAAGTTELRTTLDPALQSTVEALARSHLQRLGAEGVGNAAVVVLENRTGEVLAYMGSVDFHDARAGGQNDGVRMLRQPGSALKPFTYALALSTRRYTPATILADIETPVLEAGGAFSPENYDRTYHGPVPLRRALACSYNVPAVRLARELGPLPLLDGLRRAGFSSLRHTAEHYGVGLTLGNGEVSLLELARAYAGLARGGSLPPLRFLRWHRTTVGDTLRLPAAPVTATGLNPAVLYLVTDILRDPEARAPAFGRGGPLELPFPCAVKTGTSKDYRDNWAIGYTPHHTVAVWAGNFDGTPMRRVSGVSGAGALLKALFLHLGGRGDFPQPAGLQTATVCPVSGQQPGPHCPTTRREVFLQGTVPASHCEVHRLVRLDRRTGLLADAHTPAAEAVPTVFVVHPPLFHPWMRAHGMPFPPQVTEARTRRASTPVRYSSRLHIQYPESGTTYQLDPVLRRAWQQLPLRGAVEDGLLDVAWYVDNTRLTADYRTTRWPLQPGRHTVELRAVTPEGQRLRSQPVVIRVLDGLADAAPAR